ncbi:MAG: zinc ribbon domain-containing protein [Thermoactinospora sp.]|nr:zinc ribbon domain-containing protein [Thermoactinospora sp.]
MVRVTASATALAVVLLATGALPATAHEHPSGITDLVTPSVVRVEASQRVDITLLDHVSEVVKVKRSYDVPVGSGTGLIVNPEGAVVTLTRIVQSEQNAAIYAANRIFADHHKAKVPADFAKHTVKDDILNHHLQSCYTPEKDTSACIVEVTPTITIFPNINPPDPKGYGAVLTLAGDKPDAPAVLTPVGRADGGVGLPTAPLADKVPDQEGAPTAIAGFLGKPAADVKITTEIAHLGKGGAAGEGGRPFSDPQKKVDEPVKLGALADKGLLGAPVIGDKDGHVVGMLLGGGKDARMIGVREISATLTKANVPPRRGVVDAAFEHALARFHTKYYAEATPGFQHVLELYPGHTVAAEHLKTSLAKRGTAEDAGTKRVAAQPVKAATPLWPYIAAAAAVLLLAALAAAFLLWRRRRTSDQPVPPPAVTTPPPPLAHTPVPYDEGAHETVVVRRSQLQEALQQQPQPVLTAQETTFCTACGAKLGRGHRFCGFCGHPSET